MVEANYSPYIAEHTDALARKALLQIEPMTVANVVPFKG
jgi:hypothetical protein